MQEKIIESIVENNEELKEAYIKALPKKLMEMRVLETFISKLNLVKKEVETMVKSIGEYKNELFEINKKTIKEVKINYSKLETAMQEIEKEMPKETNPEKVEMFQKLKESIKKDIEVKKPAEKLKIVMALNPGKVEEIKNEVIKEKLELKETKKFETYMEENKEEEEKKILN